MKVKRHKLMKAYMEKHCPSCNAERKFEQIITGLAGIGTRKCTTCGEISRVDFIADPEEYVECPDNYKF